MNAAKEPTNAERLEVILAETAKYAADRSYSSPTELHHIIEQEHIPDEVFLEEFDSGEMIGLSRVRIESILIDLRELERLRALAKAEATQ